MQPGHNFQCTAGLACFLSPGAVLVSARARSFDQPRHPGLRSGPFGHGHGAHCPLRQYCQREGLQGCTATLENDRSRQRYTDDASCSKTGNSRMRANDFSLRSCQAGCMLRRPEPAQPTEPAMGMEPAFSELCKRPVPSAEGGTSSVVLRNRTRARKAQGAS